MNDEPTHAEINDDDNAPTTKGYVRDELKRLETSLRGEMKGLRTELRGEMKDIKGEMSDLRTDVEGIDQRLLHVEANMATKDQMETVLSVVTSIDSQLKELKDIPDRVGKLESDVTELMLRR